MSETFFISDTHFFHENIIRYANRPFNNVEEMNEIMIQNWNKTVKRNDVVYHLGDFSLTNNQKENLNLINKLNGKIFICPGNHDGNTLKFNGGELEVLPIIHIIKSMNLVLCHYPIYAWPKATHGFIHLYGHIHNNMMVSHNTRHKNVCVENINYTPISYEEIKNEFT